jgi:O-antigen ligase
VAVTPDRAAEATSMLAPHRTFRVDVLAYSTLFVLLLYAFSARQAVAFLGAVGTPALLLAIPTLLLWMAGRTIPDSGLARTANPLRPILWLYLAYLVGSVLLVALARPLTELERTGTGRGLLTGAAMVGLALLVGDGLRDARQARTLLRRLMIVGAFFSALGILQFFTGLPLQFRLPGLTWIHEAGGVGARATFRRPRATAMHPIEFGVVTATLLPIALHFALYEPTVHRRRLAAVVVALLTVAIPISLSRSGVVSVIVGLAVLALGWSWRRVANATLAILVIIPFFWVLVPRFTETIIGLFTDTGSDDSIQARLDRIPRVMELIRAHPWTGIGHGTYNLEDYLLLDNQLWVTTIELGMLGAALTLLLLGAAALVSFSVGGRLGADEELAHLGRAVAAAIAAMTVSIATFDAFHYRILTGTLFLLIGVGAALWRVTERPTPDVRHPLAGRFDLTTPDQHVVAPTDPGSRSGRGREFRP